jgi:hypothetical protein
MNDTLGKLIKFEVWDHVEEQIIFPIEYQLNEQVDSDVYYMTIEDHSGVLLRDSIRDHIRLACAKKFRMKKTIK